MIEEDKKDLKDISQKARIKWCQFGDENSSYFHRILNQNHRRNRIFGISLNGSWVFDPISIKSAVMDFFEQKFREPLLRRPWFSSRLFNSLSSSQSSDLEIPFSVEEIKCAVWACDGDKAQGLDG